MTLFFQPAFCKKQGAPFFKKNSGCRLTGRVQVDPFLDQNFLSAALLIPVHIVWAIDPSERSYPSLCGRASSAVGYFCTSSIARPQEGRKMWRASSSPLSNAFLNRMFYLYTTAKILGAWGVSWPPCTPFPMALRSYALLFTLNGPLRKQPMTQQYAHILIYLIEINIGIFLL